MHSKPGLLLTPRKCHVMIMHNCSSLAGVIDIDTRGEAPMRVGVITHFFRHEITCIRNPETEPLKVSTISHILAHIKWYMDHPIFTHL